VTGILPSLGPRMNTNDHDTMKYVTTQIEHDNG